MSAREVARAIDACRRGWPVTIRGVDGTLTLLPIETADGARLTAFAPDGCDVLLSPERAATLTLGNQRDAVAGAPVRVEHVPWLDLDAAVALADPANDLAMPLKGPFRTTALRAGEAAQAALKLARLAGLLPAFFLREGDDPDAPSPRAADIAGYDQPSRLRLVSRARLPIAASERCEIVAFRSSEEAIEHVALIVGAPNGSPPLVRLHSECLTGDVFGSLKCDCGPQLDVALGRISNEGWGIVLYMRQEGRGIGLVNKLRAYALQDQGFDTVDANLRLGFAADERGFAIAARMLELLSQTTIRLLTNNPDKVEGLRRAGIQIEQCLPLRAGENRHNRTYLAVKRLRAGHLL